MKKQILLLCTVALLIGNMAIAQGNWVSADQSLSPATAVLPSSGTVSASGSFTWVSTANYNNDMHMATLTFALPASIYPSTGIPSLVYANNNTPVSGVSFAITGSGWACTFGPNASFVPGTKVIFSVNDMQIKDDQNYLNQQLSHFITFLSSPSNEIVADNAATSVFETVVNGPLPVGLLSFDARLLDKGINAKVDLKWTTTVEINASHFVVERSQNAVDWAEVTSVKAEGNTTANTDYQTYDNEPFMGTGYYRLKQVDIDNSFSYSNVRVVHNAIESGVNVYPNPTSDQLNVQFSIEKEAQIEIKLLTVDGRVAKSVLLKGEVGSNVVEMDISQLANGVYEINVYKNTELLTTAKIQKN